MDVWYHVGPFKRRGVICFEDLEKVKVFIVAAAVKPDSSQKYELLVGLLSSGFFHYLRS